MSKEFNRIKKMLSSSTTMPVGAGGSAPSEFMMGSASHDHHDHEHKHDGSCCGHDHHHHDEEKK